MTLTFFNSSDIKICARIVEADSDWEAIKLGHAFLQCNDPEGGVDFDLDIEDEISIGE